jgi:hypothetical protein
VKSSPRPPRARSVEEMRDEQSKGNGPGLKVQKRAALQVGDRVQSRAAGSVAAFEGTVCRIEHNASGKPFFFVRDAAGVEWHRARFEISLIAES